METDGDDIHNRVLTSKPYHLYIHPAGLLLRKLWRNMENFVGNYS